MLTVAFDGGRDADSSAGDGGGPWTPRGASSRAQVHTAAGYAACAALLAHGAVRPRRTVRRRLTAPDTYIAGIRTSHSIVLFFGFLFFYYFFSWLPGIFF